MKILILDLYSVFIFFFFCKQKTAYDMRISDWSSDVCSSDLVGRSDRRWLLDVFRGRLELAQDAPPRRIQLQGAHPPQSIEVRTTYSDEQIGRASCRERVCQYV